MEPRLSDRPLLRIVAALALFSAWMVLLLLGSPLGAGVYLFLVAALAVFPWRLLRLDQQPRE
jgi:Flp pilus assembly protein TadB